jgi:SagB-type dehydrogenase family enzyme
MEENMNRRTFLKSVPALTIFAAARPGLTEDANTSTKFTQEARSISQTAGAVQPDTIKLNLPELDKGISIMQALKKRKTQRDITDKKLTLQQLSDLLWAADGVNRPDGKRTAPAAMAIYCVDIYAVLPEGVYFYDVPKHELKLIAKGDFRKLAGMQDFVYIAPLNLVYVLNIRQAPKSPMQVSEEKRVLWAHFEVGFLAQNVNLYCASEGLGATVRGIIDQKKFGELIKVKPEQVVLAQTIGYPK